MIHKYKINISFSGSTFGERETALNREIEKVQRALVSRGFKVIDFEVNSKTYQKAIVTFTYNG
jgi:uncharacterized protein YheU (UPF0270 family)